MRWHRLALPSEHNMKEFTVGTSTVVEPTSAHRERWVVADFHRRFAAEQLRLSMRRSEEVPA